MHCTSEEAAVHILLVEDHPDVARLMQTLLKALGATTDHAATVAEAGRLLATRAFDMVLADYRLPDGNGAQVLEQAGPQDAIKVLLSAYGKSLDVGQTDYRVESKPIEMERLRALIDEAMSAKRASGPPGTR